LTVLGTNIHLKLVDFVVLARLFLMEIQVQSHLKS